MRIVVNTPDERDIAHRLGNMSSQAPVILARAINNASVTARKIIAQEVSRTYIVKSSDVKKAFDTKKATRTQTESIIKTNSKGAYKLPLYAFKITPKMPHEAGKKRKTYKIKVLKSGSAKTFLHGFVAKMPSGHLGFFKRAEDDGHINSRVYGERRKNKHSQKIEEVYSVSIGQMANKKSIVDKATNEAENMLLRRLEHEINRALGGR